VPALAAPTRALAALTLALVVLLVAAPPPAARADGDPASDYLLVSPVFVPQDAGVPRAQQLRLLALAREAARAGVPVRVAILASPYDMGSVTALWQHPQDYARFLGSEIAYGYSGRLLVVMPSGAGAALIAAHRATAAPVPAGIAVRPGAAGLAAAAEAGIRRIAADAGDTLPQPRVAATPPPPARPFPWLPLVLGALAIAAAWTASARARPLELPPRLRRGPAG
jgi:hypothetical protein